MTEQPGTDSHGRTVTDPHGQTVTDRPGPGRHVRAVRETSRPDAWLPVADALDGRPILDTPNEQVYALGGGALVIRRSAAGEIPVTAIEFGAPDAHPGEQIAGPDGMTVAVVAATPWPHSTAAPSPRATEPSPRAGTAGARGDYHAGRGRDDDRDSHRVAGAGPVTACPLWMTPDVPGVVTALRSAGLTDRIASDTGDWVDMSAPGGGLIGVHSDGPDESPHAVLCFETADVDALASRFSERGLRGDIVDENYGRSLRFDDPDGGIEIWVNETMTDLYGYRLEHRPAGADPQGRDRDTGRAPRRP